MKEEPIQIEDLSDEEYDRLFGKVFGELKQAAGLDRDASDEALYERLKQGQALGRELEQMRSAHEQTRRSAGRIYQAFLSRLPEDLREGAPDPEKDFDSLGQWSELAARMSGRAAPAMPKPLDSSKSGGAPQAGDAETWLRLLGDSSAARAFKRTHPEEWRRLVGRFGGHPVSKVRKLIGR